MSNAKPYEIGTQVCGAFEVPAVAVAVGHVYTISSRQLRPFFKGGREVWFYELNATLGIRRGAVRCNVYHEFLKPVVDTQLVGRVS